MLQDISQPNFGKQILTVPSSKLERSSKKVEVPSSNAQRWSKMVEVPS
ncbi:MAG: hypothetical protein V7K88_29185 [Nostoc sp.]